MMRRARARLPSWPWREILGVIVALIFVVGLVLISMHAQLLAGEWHLP
ncbi:hypothetical protein NBRC103581_02572 [Gluconobacter wancherniae NBRC 103581]|nr:hypothetical protein NBRC103581_02572 [Gluconobacter wancherniae NBRC 103581]